MNKILLIVSSFFILLSCGDNKELEKKQEIKVENNDVDMDFLNDVNEGKIALISIINNVPSKDVKSIITKFIKKDFYYSWNSIDCDSECYLKIIDEISKEFNLSKEKVSLIIFKYQYTEDYIDTSISNDDVSSNVDYPNPSDSFEYDNFR